MLTNCTIALNTGIPGPGGAGGVGSIGQSNGGMGSSGSAFGGLPAGALVNTLLATNLPGGNGSAALVDLGNNLSSDASCGFTNTGALNGVDPRLGVLANYSGLTPSLPLLPGSPAIDAGATTAAPALDQRGHPRPMGAAADIGAYEYGTTPRLLISAPQGGSIAIQLLDVSGPACRLFTSTDAPPWQCVATNPVAPNGTVSFQVPSNLGEGRRLYRAVMP